MVLECVSGLLRCCAVCMCLFEFECTCVTCVSFCFVSAFGVLSGGLRVGRIVFVYRSCLWVGIVWGGLYVIGAFMVLLALRG